MTSSIRRSRKFRIASVTVAGATLAVAGAGIATAAAPHSAVAHAVKSVGQSVGLYTPPFTPDQADAFWKAGYTGGDLGKLEKLWNLDDGQTKVKAGTLLLAGKTLPVAPGTVKDLTPAEQAKADAPYIAALDAGYSPDDIAKLQAIWKTDYLPTKAHIGELLLRGDTVPVAPTGPTSAQIAAQAKADADAAWNALTPAQKADPGIQAKFGK